MSCIPPRRLIKCRTSTSSSCGTSRRRGCSPETGAAWGPTHHSFPNECFIDELAFLARADPVAYGERLVTEVTVGNDGGIKIDRMVCAVDCGSAVNPDGVDAQIQGGIV